MDESVSCEYYSESFLEFSDDRIRVRIRCIDNPSAGTDRSEQRGAAADGELGRCEPELAGMVLRRAKYLE